MRGADIGAGAAFDAVEHAALLCRHVVFARSRIERGVHGHEVHGAYVGAFAAVETGSGCVRVRLVRGHGDDAARRLGDGAGKFFERGARHGTAADDLFRVFRERAGGDDGVEGRADAHAQVLRRLDCFSRDGEHALDERFTAPDRLEDGETGRDVLHDAADCGGKFPRGDLSAGAGVNEVFFAADGILLFEDHGLNEIKCFKRRDAVGFVRFDADEDRRDPERFCDEPRALGDLGGVLQHDPVVAGEIGFALRAVDDERVDGVLRVELDRGGEACAAHADDARIRDPRLDLFGRRVGERLHISSFILFVVFNDDRAIGDALDRSAHGRMNGGTDRSACLGDELSLFDGIADGYDGNGGFSDALRKGDGKRVCGCAVFYGYILCEVFPVGNVYAVENEFALNRFHCKNSFALNFNQSPCGRPTGVFS